MTGAGGTWVSDPRGPVNSGAGNQYVFQRMTGGDERPTGTGLPRLSITQQHRRRLGSCFVRPRGFGRAADRLAAPGAAVLVDGAPGSGRRAAATMLLEGTSVPGGRIEELPPVWEEGAPGVSADDRCLMDLSHVGLAGYPEARRSLLRYLALVERCGARLVAIPPAGAASMLDMDLFPLAVRLERPRGRAVFSRYLRVRGVAFEPEQLDTEYLAHMFATAPVRELARLAELVVQARDGDGYRDGADFAAWLDEAMDTVTDRSAEAAGYVRRHRGAPQRALLLAAAMNSGAASPTVLDAARCLLSVLNHPLDRTPGLEQADFGERLEELSLGRDDGGRVTFTAPGYDSAVGRYFWENFPDLRTDFRDWVGRCVELPAYTAEDRARLIRRFAERTLSAARPDDLCHLIERWTRPSAGGHLRAEAAMALELGLTHDPYGSRFRSRVHDWAASGETSPDLARVLVDVGRRPGSCGTAEAASSAYPRQTDGNRRSGRRLLRSILPRRRPAETPPGTGA
ncbi:hypothetical protein OHA98_38055 [Streptomyces sp. NBC_00654]|uniref:hypothetical protein n=1 Tax=Streptomyces sp. NBC_00654 TaxID=2975799 RepID=UPI00225B2A5F|nr:hypothetical protein [Streptomyces sp. NBC_00654]MCX4970455.1 hypothetical protein [Streptomyces sp. NBC_00654]